MYPVINPMYEKKINTFLRNSSYSFNTEKSYRWILKHLARWMSKYQYDMVDLTPDLALDFLDSREWAGSMRAMALTAIRAYAKFYYGREHPIFDLPVKKPKPRPQRTLNEKEVLKLLESIDVSKPVGVRNFAIATVMLDTGIRAAEVCNMRMEHLDIDERSFKVVVKGGKFKAKVFSEVAAGYLEDWLVMRREYAGPGVKNVFCGIGGLTPGQPLTTSGLRNIFRKMGSNAGLASLSPHVMRRTFATLATIYGAPAVVLQKAGGWEDIKTMSIYTQAVPTRTIEAYLPTQKLLGVKPDDNSDSDDSVQRSTTIFID